MEIVHLDLKKYLKRNIFPSRTVLVFPPFNGFRRFLIHKLIEDNFASSGVGAFSIGQDISRRIVVCYKGLIREDQNKGTPGTLSKKLGSSMIEKNQNKQRLNPSAPVYRPPAARIAEARSTDESITSESKRNRVRRPDQQMYVPRPKRASYSNEQPRSRSRSSSRASIESDSCERKNKYSRCKNEESRLSGPNCVIGNFISERDKIQLAVEPEILSSSFEPINKICDDVPSCSLSYNVDSPVNSVPVARSQVETSKSEEIHNKNDLTQPFPNKYPFNLPLDENTEVTPSRVEYSANNTTLTQKLSCDQTVIELIKTKDLSEMHVQHSSRNDVIEPGEHIREGESSVIIKHDEYSVDPVSSISLEEKTLTEGPKEKTERSSKSVENVKVDRVIPMNCSKTEVMETISISSDSRDDESKHSFTTTSSSSSSTSISSSSDSEVLQRPCRRKSYEKMETENSLEAEKNKISSHDRNKLEKENLKDPASDILTISDTSSDGSSKMPQERESKSETSKGKVRPVHSSKKSKSKKPVKSKLIDPNEYDWESLYDDSGECLVPDLMEELTSSVGRVKVASVDSDYRPFQSIEERTNDGECVIEIYDFPVEFKTTDLFNVFAAYRNKNFQIKWVDDTHALGVFPSPLLADEVLACTLPFVKTRPLRLGIVESRNKARNLVLPPLPSIERPKTCTALARRLVTGALGLRLPTSSQEREREKQVLKEAREKRRLEAKQREAAWDGTLTSSSCI